MPPISKPYSRMSMARRLRGAALALGALSAAAPAHASALETAINRAHYAVSHMGLALGAYAQRLAAGDMRSIQLGAFALSGLIALTGLWLLLWPPRFRGAGAIIALPDQSAPQDDPADAEAAQAPGAQPSVRLLEAIAAAKAQMAISQAEQKRRKDNVDPS